MANTLTHGKLAYANAGQLTAQRLSIDSNVSIDSQVRQSFAVPGMNMAAINAHAIINFYTVEESLFADVEDILHDIDEILTKSTDKIVGEKVILHSIANDLHNVNGEEGRIKQVMDNNMAVVVLDRSNKEVTLPLSKLKRNLPLIVRDWASSKIGVQPQVVVSGLLIDGEDLPMFNTFKGLGPQAEIQILGYFDLRPGTSTVPGQQQVAS
ncbi:hypothetical protein GUITHDRAFT_145361 [Guillardia theta CCMP2712]|uniref:Uncharacterized protein n=1 Tax=Guillardia theta (strain CCMP2712) TaxID=905079 RepID=L1IL90_GUITC|nr:hypothetical protein GUITHDRAFT_145361 [Guillardia theta CCMP2712]EKX37011.1 hypothetical protein GUITHDRAFT_145361 [Guillardia theta CCMP2712]|eukprot:XP_005823991.1 hypothetical protein GUITHDRAFT_145361 [Guillardia theta CCMP2712]